MNTKSYLITGVSGSGKTTIVRALKALNFEAIDMDANMERYNMLEAENQKVSERAVSTIEDFSDTNWVWRRDTFEQLKSEASSDKIFFAANAINMVPFWPEFNIVFLLEIDEPTMDYRIEHRGPDTEPGVDAEVQAYQRRNLPYVQNEIREYGNVIRINNLQDIDQTVKEIIAYTEQLDQVV